MNITKLSLINFHSSQQTQTIEFASVTLLFGPNSGGKSSVLMALFYLQHVINKGQCDPQRIEAVGNKYIGGFKNLINGKDLIIVDPCFKLTGNALLKAILHRATSAGVCSVSIVTTMDCSNLTGVFEREYQETKACIDLYQSKNPEVCTPLGE